VVLVFWFIKQYDVDVQDPFIVVVLGLEANLEKRLAKESEYAEGVAKRVAKFEEIGFSDGKLDRRF